MVRNQPNITLIPICNDYVYWQQRVLRQVLGTFRIEILELGRFKEDFLSITNMKLDEIFYSQAGLPLNLRWTNFDFERHKDDEDSLRERHLRNLIGPYIFLHEDESRGFVIDRRYLEPNLPISFIVYLVTKITFRFWTSVSVSIEFLL